MKKVAYSLNFGISIQNNINFIRTGSKYRLDLLYWIKYRSSVTILYLCILLIYVILLTVISQELLTNED